MQDRKRRHHARAKAPSRPPESAALAIGDSLEATVGGPAHPGVFVVRVEDGPAAGMAVFVRDAVDGERVRVEVTEAKRRFARGVATEILEASPFRQRNIWPQADVRVPWQQRIGGADYGHIALSHQRELKAMIIRESLARIGHVTSPLIDALTTIEPLDPSDHYRTHVELHVTEDGRLGQRVARGHEIVTVDDVPLAIPEIGEIVEPGMIGGVPAGARVLLTQPSNSDLLTIVDGRIHGGVLDGTRARDVPVTMQASGHEFYVAADGFWQAHVHAATTLADAVRSMVQSVLTDGRIALSELSSGKGATAFDLYGGVGLFAQMLADLGLSVTSVEGDATASNYACENLGVSGTAVHADIRKYAQRWSQDELAGDIVVLDPPRVGAGLDVVRTLALAHPAAIVYVACDPVAMARDVGALITNGYTLSQLRAFDCFPHTHHVEAMALLTLT